MTGRQFPHVLTKAQQQAQAAQAALTLARSQEQIRALQEVDRSRRDLLVHCFFERLTVQAREDLLSGLDPNERLALVVPSVQEALDGLDQGCHASEDAAPDGPGG